MGIAALAASAFLCVAPTHHDGDAIRCEGQVRSMRLYGIDAPEMPGACRLGRQCTPGDPYASRDHLASLTQGRTVTCAAMDVDSYGRSVVRCVADSTDLSCAMVRDGYAVERYGRLDCDRTAFDLTRKPNVLRAGTAIWINAMTSLWIVPIYVLLVNLVTYFAFVIDKRRARLRLYRISESTLLALAVLGGSPAAIFAQQRLRHKTQKQPFGAILLCIIGLQLGVIIGLIAFY